MIRKWVGVLMALLLIISLCAVRPANAENADSEFPPLNEAGFLDEGEFLYMGDKEGLWRYCSSTLWIEIRRVTQEKPARVWYEAEVRCAEGAETPHMVAWNPEAWMGKANFPHKVARKNRTVLAVSSDYSYSRVKGRGGVILRDGQVYCNRTKKRGAQWPNLDTLAIWPDGDMKVYYSDEMTAEEYTAAGVRDVLAFGPWLIRDGQLNEEGLKKYGKSKAERVAVGMVEKGHYWFMMLEGRIKRCKGDGISFLAEKLLEHGCTQGFNLDGGQTACIVFMGHQLCKMSDKNNKASRSTVDILGVGTSDLVAEMDDPW